MDTQKLDQIHAFAVKWYNKFCDKDINYIQLVDHYLADDCTALGFKMCPCNTDFSDAYGRAVSYTKDFYATQDRITDIPLLGSGIYSWWRYYNHWAHTGEEILEPENRAWFIIALNHLMTLTGDNPHLFKGTLKEIRIVSTEGYYGDTKPLADEEFQQDLIFRNTGSGHFSAYTQDHTKTRSTSFKLSKPDVSMLFSVIQDYFSKDYAQYLAQDKGDWEMELINTDDESIKIKGSLCANYEYEGLNISEYIRSLVGLEDVFGLNWCKPNRLERIKVEYQKVTKTEDKGAINYLEQLLIDRRLGILELVQQKGATGGKVTHKYEEPAGVENLFQKLEAKPHFSYISGNSSDAASIPNETREYRLTLDYKKTASEVIKNSFDKRGLPVGYPDFAKYVCEFLQVYGFADILNSKMYEWVRHSKSEYVYVSVAFDWSDKTYYYLTEDDSIGVGDKVIVPAGVDNHEVEVEVVNIEYFSANFVPIPVEKTKKILRKCEE